MATYANTFGEVAMVGATNSAACANTNQNPAAFMRGQAKERDWMPLRDFMGILQQPVDAPLSDIRGHWCSFLTQQKCQSRQRQYVNAKIKTRRPRGNEEPHLGRRFAPRLVTYGAELFIDWGHRQVNFGDQCIVSQNSSFFSLYTSNGLVLLWAFFMGARIVLYVVVALLIGSSVVLAVHSLRDH